MFSRHIPLMGLVLVTALCSVVTTQAAPPDTPPLDATQQAKERPVPLPPEKLRGQIIYTQSDGLWAINPNSRQKQLLLLFPDDALDAVAFSPDRASIAFTARIPNTDDGANIFVMRWDGTQRRRLTNCSPDKAENLRWSPDGKAIAYTLGTRYIMGGPPKYSRELRVINADGTHDRSLAGTTSGGGPAAYDPFWSRDSKRVLFTFYPDALDYRGMADTKEQTRVIALDGKENQSFDGSWSQFAVPFVSRDGEWSAKFDDSIGSLGRLDLYELPDKTNYKTLWWGGEGNLTLVAPMFGPDADLLVCVGKSQGLIINAQGFATIARTYEQRSDLWLLNRRRSRVDRQSYLRLLVKNAHLVDWL